MLEGDRRDGCQREPRKVLEVPTKFKFEKWAEEERGGMRKRGLFCHKKTY